MNLLSYEWERDYIANDRIGNRHKIGNHNRQQQAQRHTQATARLEAHWRGYPRQTAASSLSQEIT